MKNVDLHIHSNHSDGLAHISEIIENHKNNGWNISALTAHGELSV